MIYVFLLYYLYSVIYQTQKLIKNHDFSCISLIIYNLFTWTFNDHIVFIHIFLYLINSVLFLQHKSAPFIFILLLFIDIILCFSEDGYFSIAWPNWIWIRNWVGWSDQILRLPVFHVIYVIVAFIAHVSLTIDIVSCLWFYVYHRRDLLVISWKMSIIYVFCHFFIGRLLWSDIYSKYFSLYLKL